MATHTVRLGLVQTTSAGVIILPQTGPASTWDYSDTRILYNSTVANSVGNPTIDSYLALEGTAGYYLSYMTEKYIVTHQVNPNPLNIASCHAITAVGSSTLETLGVTVNPNIRAFTFIPRPGAVVYYNIGGAASASTPLILSGGMSFTCTHTSADTVYLYSATVGVNLDIIQHI